MFVLGFAVGVVVAAAAAFLVVRRQQRLVAGLERNRSAEFRRITELERTLAAERVASATALREAKLRADREFEQYKILLKRADRALADARAARDRGGRLAA